LTFHCKNKCARVRSGILKATKAHNVIFYNEPLMICFLLSCRTVSSVLALPQHLSMLQERLQLLFSVSTLSLYIPLG
jgi:hypothetical protein